MWSSFTIVIYVFCGDCKRTKCTLYYFCMLVFAVVTFSSFLIYFIIIFSLVFLFHKTILFEFLSPPLSLCLFLIRWKQMACDYQHYSFHSQLFWLHRHIIFSGDAVENANETVASIRIKNKYGCVWVLCSIDVVVSVRRCCCYCFDCSIFTWISVL